MCGQHNARASAGDNTGQNTKDTHPIPGQKLKFLTLPGIESGPPRVGRQGLYQSRHGDGSKFYFIATKYKFTGKLVKSLC